MAASLAVRPAGWRSDELPRLSLVAGLAARSVLGDGVRCKWPNDLLRDEAKVAGLLLEVVEDLVVIGLGVNLWWPDPPPGYGAVHAADPGPDKGAKLASRWCEDLLVRIDRGPDSWGHAEYRRVCETVGRFIRRKPDGIGQAIDVDTDGRLVVETDSGRLALSSGEVWEVR
jgi:BirA family biotin operon repressor/biotin-[acetyl-CoA-carboxylase] ligase